LGYLPRESGFEALTRWLGRRWVALALVILTLLAATARFYELAELPAGIYRDEAYEGLDALAVLDGRLALFFTANNGREPLFVYLLTPLVWLFGRSAFALRLLPAIAGTLLVPATYVLGREMLGRDEGLVAAVLAAFSVWTMNLSRLAMRVSLLPLMTALALVCLTRGLRLRRWPWMAGCGLLMALGFNTYLAARFSLLAVGMFGLYSLWCQRRAFWWRGWLALTAALVVCAAPLAAYYIIHPEDFFVRSGQVSILNMAVNQGNLPYALARSVWRTMLGFVYRGDFIPRHNIPLRPFLEPVIALSFAGGLLLLGRRARTSENAVLIWLWLALLCLPTILTEGAPHMLRAAGILPVLFLPAATGLAWFTQHMRPVRCAWLGAALVAVTLMQAGAGAILSYQAHLRSDAAYYNYESGVSQLAAEINASIAEPSARVFVARRLWDSWPSLRFLCGENERLDVLHADGTALSPAAGFGPVRLFLWPYENNDAALALLPPGSVITVNEGTMERGDLDTEARLLYIAYRADMPGGMPGTFTPVRWEHGITLIGAGVRLAADGRLLVELTWLAEETPGRAFTVYVHLLRDGHLSTQHDGPAAYGYYGTERWRAGDIIVDRHSLTMDQPYLKAGSQVVVGLYSWPELTPLSLLGLADPGTSAFTLPEQVLP